MHRSMLAMRRIPGSRRLLCSATADQVTITTPDDWHLHVRDQAGMKSVVHHTAAHFRRAVIMPNLVPPVTTADKVCHITVKP